MSELITVARPYARAAFDYALEHDAIAQWQAMLAYSSEVAHNDQIVELISASLAPTTLATIFIAACGDALDAAGQNFIKILAENRRLSALAEVLAQFTLLSNQHQSIAEVDVVSASTLSDEQLEKIRIAMEKRLSRKIKLHCQIDKSVIGGVIIRVEDLVIDGTIRNRLNRLADILQY